MMSIDAETEIIVQLLKTMTAAITAGDWKVDGANDPELAMRRASAYLEQRRWVPDDSDVGPAGAGATQQEK